jgi:hypothetical protein
MKPSIGRIVIYKTTEADKAEMKKVNDSGKYCNIQDEVPAIIVAVWGESCINARVLCDGHLDLYPTSINLGDEPGNWNWPAIVK